MDPTGEVFTIFGLAWAAFWVTSQYWCVALGQIMVVPLTAFPYPHLGSSYVSPHLPIGLMLQEVGTLQSFLIHSWSPENMMMIDQSFHPIRHLFLHLFQPPSRHGWRGGGWPRASVSDCLPLAVPIGLLPLLIVTPCGPERVLVVSTEPLDDLSCLTTPRSAVPETGCCPCR